MKKFILVIVIYGLFNNSIYELFNNTNQECNPKAPTKGCSRRYDGGPVITSFKL